MRQWVLILFLLLTACQIPPERGEQAPAYLAITPGSELFLNQPLSIMPNSVSAYLQYGELMAFREVDRYYANCKFELYSISESKREVKPDRFLITRVTSAEEIVSWQMPRLASGDVGIGFVFGKDGGGPTAVIYTVIIYLKSMGQPDVFRLSCQHWDDPAMGVQLTVAEVRQALGHVMTLKIAGTD